MKLVFVLFLIIYSVIKSATGLQDARTIVTVNDFLDRLTLETWHEEESACRDAVVTILNGVKNNTLWATWVWDSMQLPVGTLYGSLYHLGNFDQCLNAPWPLLQSIPTQYCLVDVKLTVLNKNDEKLIDPYGNAERYVGAEFRNGKRLNTIFLGVCLPASCKSESIAKITRNIFSQSHLPFKDVMVDPRDCQVAGKVQKPMEFYAFWLILVAMASSCTLLYIFGNTQDKSNSTSTVSKLTRCFCLTRNFDALTEIYKDEIKVIHGMRALTCGILVVAHLVLMSQLTFINQLDVEKELINDPLTKLSLHVDLCVDTFLVMSGLLHFRSLLSSKSYQPFKTMFKRYLRLLVPVYILNIMCMSYVLPYIGSGPVWPKMARKHFEPCARSWWGNLLMLTNKVDGGALCSITSWQIHCDFQLSVLATVIYMVYRRNKKTGILLYSLAYFMSVAFLVIWNYWHELPGLLWYDFGESLDFEANRVFQSVYTPFYARTSSYVIGVAMGYIMTAYKPQNYRKSISKNMSILGFIVSMTLLVLCLEVGVKMFEKEFSPFVTAIIAAFDKTFWSIGICFIIIVCEYGTLPIINGFLGSKVFVPLSKLSYSNYLCHTIFIYREIFSFRTPSKFDMLGLIIGGLGYVVISTSVCYLVWLFIEAPVTNLINLVFDFNRTSKIHRLNEAIHSNGVLKAEKVL